MLMYLFGGYERASSELGIYIRFLTRRGAERYGRGFSGIDPVARYLDLPVTFVPGRLFRRSAPS